MSSHERHSYHTLGTLSEPSEKEIVRDRLTRISAGAEIVSRNVRALPVKPPFKTAARDELLDAEQALEATLQKIRVALNEYNAKEIAV
jgi:hypothetical protein